MVHASHALASGHLQHPSSGTCNIILQWNSFFHDGIKSTLKSSLRWCDVCRQWSCGWDLMSFFSISFLSLLLAKIWWRPVIYFLFIILILILLIAIYFFILFWYIFSSISSRIIWFNLIFKSNLVFILLIFLSFYQLNFVFNFIPNIWFQFNFISNLVSVLFIIV
jgi:hypothetical protein